MNRCLAGLVCMALLSSCSSEDPMSPKPKIIGSGVPITVTRAVSPFHSLKLHTVGTVNVTQGASQSVSITVDDNIVDHIGASVANGILEIGVAGDVQLSDFELTVDVAMIDIERLALLGAGTITSVNTIRVDSLSVQLLGVGDFDLKLVVAYLHSLIEGVGDLTYQDTVSNHVFNLTGSGSLMGFDLVSDSTEVNISGQGSSEVTVNDLLDVNISGSGTVFYRGQPTVNVAITGIGQVVDAN